jgi:hypothetical protein
VRPGAEAAANLIRGRMQLCGNPTGSRASIVWMQATVVPMPMPAAAAAADADVAAAAVMTAAESHWLTLQLGGAAGPYLNLFCSITQVVFFGTHLCDIFSSITHVFSHTELMVSVGAKPDVPDTT